MKGRNKYNELLVSEANKAIRDFEKDSKDWLEATDCRDKIIMFWGNGMDETLPLAVRVDMLDTASEMLDNENYHDACEKVMRVLWLLKNQLKAQRAKVAQ